MFVHSHHRGIVPSGIITDGLIHRWAMDEGVGTTLFDSAPDGTEDVEVTGMTDFWVPGWRLAFAVNWDGNGVAFLSQQYNIGTVHSVTFSGLYSSLGGVVLGGSTALMWMFRALNASTNTYSIASGNNAAHTIGSYLGAPHAFGIARNGVNIDFYLNGSLVDTQALSANQPFLLETISSQFTTKMQGRTEDLRYYDRVLSPAEFALIAANNG